MATLQTIKARVAESARKMSDEEPNALHKRLVEDVLCGLDIQPARRPACRLQHDAGRADRRLRAQ